MCEDLFLIEIIKFLLNGGDKKYLVSNISEDFDWNKLLRTASRHHIGHLPYHILPFLPKSVQPGEKIKSHMQELAMQAAVLDIHQQMEKEALLRVFEEQGLYCMTVKGCNTKSYYPKSEYRTMGDLDILYKPEQHNEVKMLLLNLGYDNYESGLKHDHYSKPPYITIEMHRALVAANTMSEDYYSDIWEKTSPREGFQYVYQMTLEEEYVYAMIHLMEHFKGGGVGIRFVMDIAMFLKQRRLNREVVKATFQKLGILKFARNIELLAERWFGEAYDSQDEKTEAILEELSTFIINNGLYGKASQVRALALEKEGKMGYIRRVVFPNLNSMQTLYPWLDKRTWLLPAAWLVRIVRTVLCRRGKIKIGIDTIKYGDVKKGKELREFYERCGL